MGCWDQSRAHEQREAAAEAKRDGVKVHVGRIFDMCVENKSLMNMSRTENSRVGLCSRGVTSEMN